MSDADKSPREFYILDPAEDGWLEHIVHESHDYDEDTRHYCEVEVGAPMLHLIEFSGYAALKKDLQIVRDSQERQRDLNRQAWEREKKLQKELEAVVVD